LFFPIKNYNWTEKEVQNACPFERCSCLAFLLLFTRGAAERRWPKCPKWRTGRKEERLLLKIAKISTAAYLKIGIFVHINRDHSHIRQKTARPPHNVLLGQPQLTGRIQASVIDRIVVALGQKFNGVVISERHKKSANRVMTKIFNLKSHFSCSLITRWTIGMSRPSTLNTTISPTRTGSSG
jgi:hypothetical protein